MNHPVNMAVVGCGYWGPNLIRNFRSLPTCRMKTMCDLREERLEALRPLYPEVEATSDFKGMLGDNELDAVAIACPVRYHHSLAKECLEAGKHVFIEKPMAASSEECQDLIETADRLGLTLMVGHTFLYSAPVRKIKELVDQRAIGSLHYISSRRLNLGLFQKDINVAWDLAPHDISIILYIMEEAPIRVNCQGNSHVTQGVEDITSMCLTFSRGRFATIQNSWIDPRKVREMTIVGSRRMIVYDDVEPLEKIKIYDSRVEAPPHYNSFAEFQYSYHYGDIYTPCIRHEEPLRTECLHFLECIRTGATPLSDGRQGLELVRILEAATASLAQGGGPVELERPAAARNGNGVGWVPSSERGNGKPAAVVGA